MTKLKVYLAGTCGEDELRYRVVAKDRYGNKLTLIDPFTDVEANISNDIPDYVLGESWRLSDDHIKQIVEADKEVIVTCDIVVAYINRYTCGTIMEIERFVFSGRVLGRAIMKFAKERYLKGQIFAR